MIELSPAWIAIFSLSVALAVALGLVYRISRSLLDQRSKTRGLSVRHGLIAEQFLPFSKKFPGDPRNFRFLGSPVDGIAFEKDRLIIVEFKSGRSRLSPLQRHIKDLVLKGKVYFQEIRVGD